MIVENQKLQYQLVKKWGDLIGWEGPLYHWLLFAQRRFWILLSDWLIDKLYSGTNAAIDNYWKTRSWTETVYFTGKWPQCDPKLTPNDLIHLETIFKLLQLFNQQMRFRVWLIRLTYESLSRCSMSQNFFWWLIIMTHFLARGNFDGITPKLSKLRLKSRIRGRQRWRNWSDWMLTHIYES